MINRKKAEVLTMSEFKSPQISDYQKLTVLNNVSTVPLLTIQTVFPFRLFPCMLSLDRQKLTISDHLFFGAKQVENILAEDIVSVNSTENFLFATLTVVSGMRLNKEFKVAYLWKEDARRLRRMLEGLLIASREGVDVLNISDSELIQKLEHIGTAKM